MMAPGPSSKPDIVPQRIGIYGAGAIGGLLGARLAAAGHDVTLIARGEHLAAIRERGLRLTGENEDFIVRPKAFADPAEASEQDHVILCVKAPALRAIVGKIAPLLGPATSLVSAANGIPWWYCHGLKGPMAERLAGRALASIDPDGALWRGLDPRRAIGCVVYPAAHIAAPGHVHHEHGQRFMLGEADGSMSPRLAALSRALTEAGFKAPMRADIRADIWLKLWGNLAFNPVSALTGGTLRGLAEDRAIQPILRAMMAEAERVAAALGVKMSVDIDTRIGWARDVGDHKTSMLQDLEAGRAMEIDALTGIVAEFAEILAIPVPTIDFILALIRHRARLAGCYPKAEVRSQMTDDR